VQKKKQTDNYSEIRARGLGILARILAESIAKDDPLNHETSNVPEFSVGQEELDHDEPEVDEGDGNQT